MWAATTRVSWALPWGGCLKFPGAGGRGLSAQALETPGATFSSSRIHRATGDLDGQSGAQVSEPPRGFWTVGGPPLANSAPAPQTSEPCVARCGGSGPRFKAFLASQALQTSLRPARHLDAPSHEPGGLAPFPRKKLSFEATGLSGAQCEPRRRSQHKFRGRGVYPPSEVPQGEVWGPHQDRLTICGLRKAAGPVSSSPRPQGHGGRCHAGPAHRQKPRGCVLAPWLRAARLLKSYRRLGRAGDRGLAWVLGKRPRRAL
ncbi:uncharacterized protein LOC111824396 [Myotis lucifugus]|uniref:uncharacterized protein LOC111824396 n=1 Tax=Myotis lucifugus TaxID=59463 RepID=UPI000CCC7F7F|nr:uncharacterized protein LOC111824396 [Myotis lucifugus]